MTQFEWWINPRVKTHSGDITNTKVWDRLLYLVDKSYSSLFLGSFGPSALTTNQANLRNEARRSNVVVTEATESGTPDAISFQHILQLPGKVRVEMTCYCPDVRSLMAHLQSHLVKALEVSRANKLDVMVYWPDGEVDNSAVMDRLRERLCEPIKYGDTEDISSCVLGSLQFDQYLLGLKYVSEQVPKPK